LQNFQGARVGRITFTSRLGLAPSARLMMSYVLRRCNQAALLRKNENRARRRHDNHFVKMLTLNQLGHSLAFVNHQGGAAHLWQGINEPITDRPLACILQFEIRVGLPRQAT
jgi:hypothetical protein